MATNAKGPEGMTLLVVLNARRCRYCGETAARQYYVGAWQGKGRDRYRLFAERCTLCGEGLRGDEWPMLLGRILQ